MRALISGGTGFLGRALADDLRRSGWAVTCLTRRPHGPEDLFWDPAAERLDLSRAPSFQAVIHLAGENIAAGRWTKARKARILDSRARGTRLLAEGVARLPQPPLVFVSASGVGYYGASAGRPFDESSPAGTDFLARVCQEWEAATRPCLEAGSRVVIPRFGIVLDRRGGALAKMLPAFRWGLGGRLGSGLQRMSWVSLEDAIGAIRFSMETSALAGPFNVVAPNPCTNSEFTCSLAKALGRPAILPVPAMVLRLLLGELAETLLGDSAVLPTRLLAAGFAHRSPTLEAALQRALGH